MKTLTAKYIHEKLKRNWTASDFARELGISTDEFWSLLQKQFPGYSYKDFRISLKANEKRSRRTNAPDIFSDSTTPDVTPTEVPDTSYDIAPTSSESTSDSTIVDTPQLPESDSAPVAPSLPTLDELLGKLEDLCSDINSEELVHKDIVSARSEIRIALQGHHQALIDLRKQVSQHESEISTLLSELETTAIQMHESTGRIQALQEAKLALESRIEKAKHVSIFIYNSGEVEVETQATIQFPECDDLFSTIVNEEELTNLTIRQVRSLAKVIALVRLLRVQGNPYEVFFEDETSENYFEKAIS